MEVGLFADIVGWLCTCFLLWDTVRRRQRLNNLRILRATPMQQSALAIDEDGADDYRVWTAHGTVVPPGVAAAAVMYARNEGLVGLDITPTSWSGLDALAFSSRVDTRTYREDRLSVGVSAGCMLVASTRHLSRVDSVPESLKVSSRELAGLSEQLKVAAPDRVVHRAGPGVVPPRQRDWMLVLAAGSQSIGLGACLRPLLSLVLWALGIIFLIDSSVSLSASVGVVMALAVWLLQPALTLGGGAFSPHDLAALIWTRPIVECVRCFRLLQAALLMHSTRQHLNVAASATIPQVSLTSPMFREERTCPLCIASSKRTFTRRDTWTKMPGEFDYCRCQCGTVYARRLLSTQAEEAYWSREEPHFGMDLWSRWHRLQRRINEDRVSFVYRWLDPHHWLDIACVDGAFGAVATQYMPATEFEGVDRQEHVHTAVRRRWLSRGHRGEWREVHDERLQGRQFDVISMWLGLELSPSPVDVLDDLSGLLSARGVIAFEGLDPTSIDARLLGSAWPGYAAPFLYQLIPYAQLLAYTRERGWRVLAVERRRAHRFGAISLSWLCRCRAAKGQPGVTVWGLRWRPRGLFSLVLGTPVMLVLDAIVWAMAMLTGKTNSYRILVTPGVSRQRPT